MLPSVVSEKTGIEGQGYRCDFGFRISECEMLSLACQQIKSTHL